MHRDATAEGSVSAPPLAALRRSDLLAEDYSVGAHLARTLTVLAIIGSFSLWLAWEASLVDWLLLPVFFVFANLLEWSFHRGPMHRPLGPRVLYKNHSLIHHRAFSPTTMPIDRWKELGLIMMPWYTMVLLFVLSSPVAMVGAAARGVGLGGVFLLAACLYFVLYEGLHALYHMPEHVLERLHLAGNRTFVALQNHHRHHHDMARMSHVNFNVTFPLMDWLLGTREPGTDPVNAPGKAAPEESR